MHQGSLTSNSLQATAFYHSDLPPHSVDSAPKATDTQIHFIPSCGNEELWDKVRVPSVLADNLTVPCTKRCGVAHFMLLL